jgi:signal transduction histidine kinase
VSRRPRLTIRARLTLIYTGLLGLCGAIIVAVSYALVAQQGVAQTPPKGTTSGETLADLARQCQAQLGAAPIDKEFIAKCLASFQQQGAQAQYDLTLSHLLQYSLVALVVVIAIAAVLGWFFAGRALRPVQRITAAARAASERDLSARVGLHGPRDELRELADTFDEMLDRLQAAFEGQRRFIANASHELRTPLTVMRTTIDVVRDDPDATPDDLRGMATDIRAAVDRAEHLFGALLILARNDRGLTVREEVDLATVAEDVLDTADAGDRRVHATLAPAPISGDAVLAERLVSNLVANAVRYNVTGGDIWIATGSAAGASQLTVANTGPVISPADAERIFEPFQQFAERTSHEGVGLGLAIVRSIAAVHGGTAAARPREGGGLAVTVTIPLADPGRVAGAQATERPAVPRPA